MMFYYTYIMRINYGDYDHFLNKSSVIGCKVLHRHIKQEDSYSFKWYEAEVWTALGRSNRQV